MSRSGGAAARPVLRWLLGVALIGAGVGHLTAQRTEFRAQVPGWFPIDEDVVVVASGSAAAAGRKRTAASAILGQIESVFSGDAAGADPDGVNAGRRVEVPDIGILARFGAFAFPEDGERA